MIWHGLCLARIVSSRMSRRPVSTRLAAILAVVVLSGLASSPGPAGAQSALDRYEEACDGGQVAACALLGLMLERGAGVPRDVARAATLYERACGGGELRGCTNLGLLLESGTAVPRDRDRAATLYRRACDAGEPLGCDLLQALEQTPAQRAFSKVGRVEDDASGDPLAEALVEVPALGVRAISDASGRVDLGRLPEGRHGLTAQRFGFELVGGWIEVPGNAEFVIRLPRAAYDDPTAGGRIIGRVLGDGAAQGLANVEITAGDGAARTLSNAQGSFTLDDVAPGLVEVRFAQLGYAQRATHVVVQPGGTVEVTATLSAEAIALDAIDVTVRSNFLERSGFYSRALQGWGTQYGPEDIARIDPLWTSDLVRRVPGVTVRMGTGGVTYALSRRGSTIGLGPCLLSVYVDGVRAFDPDLDDLPPHWIEAMEVYHGVGTPVQFGDGCGVILIWTNR